MDANTLGVQPTQIKIDRGATEDNARHREDIRRPLGEPPEDWDQWTHAAEEGILARMRIRCTGAACTGGAMRYKQQTISRGQDGKYGLGADPTYRRLRKNGGTPRQVLVAAQPPTRRRRAKKKIQQAARRCAS